jgi:hypothetical protein
MDTMIKQCAFLSLFILVGLTALPVGATTITTFSDKTTFLAGTGATSATGALPNLGLISGGASASQTVGSVTFTITAPSTELYVGTLGLPFSTWTTLLPGNQIAISGVKNLNGTLAGPVYAYGFDFVAPLLDSPPGKPSGYYCPCVDTTFTETLKNSGATVGSFTFDAAPHDVAAFVGVQSSSAFDRVEISQIGDGTGNKYFGQVYTATTSPSLVANPEPSTVLLMGMGSGALLLWGRYRKMNV